MLNFKEFYKINYSFIEMEREMLEVKKGGEGVGVRVVDLFLNL